MQQEYYSRSEFEAKLKGNTLGDLLKGKDDKIDALLTWNKKWIDFLLSDTIGEQIRMVKMKAEHIVGHGEWLEQANFGNKYYFLDLLLRFRYKYIDDIPEKRVEIGDKNYYFYKSRGNYFAGVIGLIYRLIKSGIVYNEDVINDGERFIKYIRQRNPKLFYTKEEIEMVNLVLDEFVKELK